MPEPYRIHVLVGATPDPITGAYWALGCVVERSRPVSVHMTRVHWGYDPLRVAAGAQADAAAWAAAKGVANPDTLHGGTD